MLTLHTKETEKNVTLSKKEFSKILKKLKKVEEIEVVADYDPDYLTKEESKQLKIAEKEFEKGETISWEEVKKELAKKRENELQT